MNRLVVGHRPLSRAEEAEAVANAHYKTLEAEVTRVVRRRLAARNMRMDASDVEDAYCHAWHGVCEQIKRGTKIRNLTGLLVEITFRRAADMYRDSRPAQHADMEIEAHGIEVALDERLDDRVKLQRFIARLKGRLNDQERNAVSLTLIHGYSRREAAGLLGVSAARMEKIMDGATPKIGAVVESMNSRGCGDDEWSRMLRDFAFGVLSEDHPDHARAGAHIEGCVTCRHYVMGLRGIAAITPPTLPFMPVGHDGGLLAHLERLFGSGHSGAVAVQGASAGTVGAAGSGGGLLSSMGGGAALKGAGLIVIAAVAAGATVHVSGHHHEVHRHRPPASASAANSSVVPGSLLPGGASSIPTVGRATPTAVISRPHPGRVRRVVAAHETPSARVATEFGFEHRSSEQAPSTPVAVAASRPKASPPAVATQPEGSRPEGSRPGRSRGEEQQSAEFGFEHRKR